MEKFDGMRVFWDGRILYSADKKLAIQVPTELGFPSIPFEGELWCVDKY
jgi:hypothetical protein